MPEARTSRPHPTGYITGSWSERFGIQRLEITADPRPGNTDSEFTVTLERQWGPQLTDHRRQDLRLNRAGATELRDALTAALNWHDPDAPQADAAAAT